MREELISDPKVTIGAAVMSRSAAIALALTLAGGAPAEAGHCPLGQLYRVTLGECVGLRSALARGYVHRPAPLRVVRLAERPDDPPDPPAALSDTALLATAAEIAVNPAMLGESPSPAARAGPGLGLAPRPPPSQPSEADSAPGHPLAFSSRPRRRSAPEEGIRPTGTAFRICGLTADTGAMRNIACACL